MLFLFPLRREGVCVGALTPFYLDCDCGDKNKRRHFVIQNRINHKIVRKKYFNPYFHLGVIKTNF